MFNKEEMKKIKQLKKEWKNNVVQKTLKRFKVCHIWPPLNVVFCLSVYVIFM